MAVFDGRGREAEELAKQAISSAAEAEVHRAISEGALVLGMALALDGRVHDGLASVKRGLEMSRGQGEVVIEFLAISALGRIAVQQGDMRRAVILAAAPARPLPLVWQGVVEEEMVLARDAIGDSEFDRYWQLGKQMPLDQVVAYALGEVDEAQLTAGGTTHGAS